MYSKQARKQTASSYTHPYMTQAYSRVLTAGEEILWNVWEAWTSTMEKKHKEKAAAKKIAPASAPKGSCLTSSVAGLQSGSPAIFCLLAIVLQHSREACLMFATTPCPFGPSGGLRPKRQMATVRAAREARHLAIRALL